MTFLVSKYFIQSQCNDLLKFRAIKFLSLYITISYQMFSALLQNRIPIQNYEVTYIYFEFEYMDITDFINITSFHIL